jgi:hypothetical protein
MSRRFTLLLSIFFLLHFCLYSQESKSQKKQDFWQRVSIGGNLGLQFGSVTSINISPEIIYRAVDQLYIGVGFSYDYLSAQDYYWDTTTNQFLDFKANVYGGRIFARYYLRGFLDNFLGNFFGHIEYEYLYYTRPFKQDPYGDIIDPYGYTYRHGNDVQEINSLFLGVGYEQPFSEKAFMDILVLYNVNETYNSPYSNPIFRLGFGVRL